MSNVGKLIIGFIASGTLVCLLAAAAGLILMRSTGIAVGRALQSDPGQVAEIAGAIDDYDLPAGFRDAYARQVAGFDLVTYTGQDGHSHVTFFQLPKGLQVDPAEIERQLKQATGGPDNEVRQIEIVGQVPATICGQATTLVVSEGTNSDGQAFRQVSAIFQGKDGQALVVFERPASSWDQAEVDSFLASIH